MQCVCRVRLYNWPSKQAKKKKKKKTENPLLNTPIMHESPRCCDVRFTCVPSFHWRRRLLCREQWSHGLQLVLLHVPRWDEHCLCVVIKRWAGTRSFPTQWGNFISFSFCQTNPEVSSRRNKDEEDCLWGRKETNSWHLNPRRRGIFSSARSDCKREWFGSTCRSHPRAVINGHSTPRWSHRCPCCRHAIVKTSLLCDRRCVIQNAAFKTWPAKGPVQPPVRQCLA